MGKAGNYAYEIVTKKQYRFRAWIEELEIMLYDIEYAIDGSIGLWDSYFLEQAEEQGKKYRLWDGQIEEIITNKEKKYIELQYLEAYDYMWFDSGFIIMPYIFQDDDRKQRIYAGDIYTETTFVDGRAIEKIWEIDTEPAVTNQHVMAYSKILLNEKVMYGDYKYQRRKQIILIGNKFQKFENKYQHINILLKENNQK